MSEFDGDPPSGSAGGSADADLAALADEAWDTAMRSSPLTATTLGDPRFHGQLADNSPSGLTAAEDRLRALRQRAVGLPADGLDQEGLITRSALVSFLDAKIAELVPKQAEWSVDPMMGPQVSLLTIGAEQPVTDAGQRRAAAERWRLMAGYVDQHAANLCSAAGEGRVAAACLVRKVIGQLDDLLGTPPSESPLLDPARRASAAGAAADVGRFGADLEQAVLEGVMPAFARLRTVLVEQILPRARSDDEAGIGFLPDGQTLYRQAIRGFTTLDVDPMVGPQVSLLTIGAEQPVSDTGQRRAAVERWRLMAGYVDQHAANLRSAADEGRVAAACLVRKVIGQIDDLLATPLSESPLLDPARRASAVAAAADATRFGSDLEQAVLEVMPAFARLRTVLAEEILPRARSDDEAGIGFLTDGQTLYRQAIRGFTTLDVDPEAVHRTGLREVERNDAELAGLACSELGTTDLATALDRLRRGTGLGFDSREGMLAAARATVARAEAAVPEWFGLREETPCEVVPTPRHEEAHSPPAQYRLAAEDGSRPGRYWITTSEPGSRPRFLLEVQCFHEAVPGHHLQLGVAARLRGLPDFRRRAIVPAYAEGWGLYAEHLAGDMGLYSTRLDRLGACSQDALRSCRLVVDTGMHAFGWSRQRAIDYLLSHTALSERAAAAEVDRYLAWPGQALAYKLGQIELLDLRRRAGQHLGARFDVRRFHDIVLGHGSLPLAVVREIVEGELGLDRNGTGPERR